MVQSGIAYAAGQLLAVVAPRTVLVVDAPTDWSLAGPLWELALDDAPVDEILDVLIRRGIRTAPSFAIVRVENDAVRALVRGSVPVCFERVGEPVRLDATGATTWLEGLISSARRVLVGAVETNSTLPYLVSTGVVLVSGLALPCGPAELGDRNAITPSVTEADDPDGGGSGDSSYFSRASAPVASGSSAFTPVSREPRVVDLTRNGARTPAKAFVGSSDSHALAGARSATDAPAGPLNGHGLSTADSAAKVDSAPVDFNQVSADDPGELQDQDPSPYPSASSYSSGLTAAPPAEPEAPRAPDLFDDRSSDADPAGESSRPPLIGLPKFDSPSGSRSQQPSGLNGVPVQPRAFGGVPAAWPPATETEADGGEDQSSSSYSGSDSYSAGEAYSPPADEPAKYESPQYEAPKYESPKYESPKYEAPKYEAPKYESPIYEAPKYDYEPADSREQQDDSTPDNNAPDDKPISASSMPAFLPPVSSVDSDRSAPGELPLRVRGSSLRPEHRPVTEGLNGNRPLGGETERPQSAPELPRPLTQSRFRDMNGHSGADEGNSSNGGNGMPRAGNSPSGNLVLPTFFRGARNARKPGEPETPEAPGSADNSTDNHDADSESAPSSWLQESSNPSAPAAWVAPVRRGFPAPEPAPEPPIQLPGSGFSGTGFNAGPPAMPGVLRPIFPNNNRNDQHDQNDQDEYEFEDEPTEATHGPMDTPGGGNAFDPAPEPQRDPPRLLGVWCDAGHVTSPDHRECRVCGLSVPPQAPILVARPSLGVLIFDNGDRVNVDRPVVLGRDPKQVSSPDPETPVLHSVPSATGQVSRTHAEIRADGWDVLITDLDAMNGTALTLPGSAPVAIEPGVPTLITPGTRVDLGGESGFVFEVES